MLSCLEELRDAVASFRDERDWSQFHTPKDLAIAISIEAAELLEIYLWKPSDAALTPDQVRRTREEMADVFIFLLSMADRLGIDLATELKRKLKSNAHKYPADLVKGSPAKYTEYGG